MQRLTDGARSAKLVAMTGDQIHKVIDALNQKKKKKKKDYSIMKAEGGKESLHAFTSKSAFRMLALR
jgi:hypothetical protein